MSGYNLKFKDIKHRFIPSFLLIAVFTQPGLEGNPTYQVPPAEVFGVPKPGTVDWEMATEDHIKLFESTMDRLRQRTNQRRVLSKPVFQDFDK